MITIAVAKQKSETTAAFGKLLRELREAAGLSQAQLGERAGMKYQAIARFERGERSPTLETFISLADALGVTLDKLRPGGK